MRVPFHGLVVAVSLLGGACAGDRADTTDRLTVFAAASLTDAFTELGRAFTAANPGVDVEFSFAASSDLAAQLAEGAPADVFASADQQTMDTVVASGLAETSSVFATNVVEIIVEAGNPERIATVTDLADPRLIVVACVATAPCGRYARSVLNAAGVDVRFRSLEENPRAVASKVILGEADAGIVYRSDVVAAGGAADGVEIPASINVIAAYPVAVTTGASAPDLARSFVDFVMSAAGRAILVSFGFTGP